MGYGVGYQAASDASMNERDKLTARIAELEAALRTLLSEMKGMAERSDMVADDEAEAMLAAEAVLAKRS